MIFFFELSRNVSFDYVYWLFYGNEKLILYGKNKFVLMK